MPLAWAGCGCSGSAARCPPREPGRSRRPAAGDRRARRRWLRRARVAGALLLAAAADALRARGSRGNPAAGGAGAAVGAIACGVTLAPGSSIPYAAALLLPAAHLWLFLGVPQTRLHGRLAWIALAAGLLAPLLVLVYEPRALRAGPAGVGAHVARGDGGRPRLALWSALALGALAGCVATLVRILRARRRIAAATPEEPLRTRGPAGYAGPGSLGGTESALRR